MALAICLGVASTPSLQGFEADPQTTLPSGQYEVAQRLVDAARDIGTDVTRRWANDTQTWINHHDIETLKGQVSVKIAPSVANETAPQLRKLETEVTRLKAENRELMRLVRELTADLTTLRQPVSPGTSAPTRRENRSLRFAFGEDTPAGTAETTGTVPTMSADTALGTLPTIGDTTS